MKITFHTNYDGEIKVRENENKVLEEMGISLEGLDVALEIANVRHDYVTHLLSHKVMWVAVPQNKVEDKYYKVYPALYIKGQGGLVYFNGEVMKPENGDCIFTKKNEAKMLADTKNEIELSERMIKSHLEGAKEWEENLKKLKSKL